MRDRILLYGKQRRDTLEYLKFIAGIRAQLLDRSKSEEVNSFNELIQEVTEYYFEGSKKPKTTVEEKIKIMEDFKKLKGTKFKLANFKKVRDGNNPPMGPIRL